MSKLKSLLILQTIIIVILAVFLLDVQKSGQSIAANNTTASINAVPKDGLLSPRVYSGLLKPKSYLITNFGQLKNDLLEEPDNRVSVYIENLRDGANFDIQGTKEFPSLSLSKVPLAILVMQKIESGKLSLDTSIQIKDKFRDDSFGDLYKNSAKELPLSVLMKKMLSESDNTAFHALLDFLDKKDLKLLLDYFPIDFDYYYKEGNSTQNVYLTVKDYSNVFRSLYLSTLLSAADSEYILNLLTNSTFEIKKLASLPDEVKVAQKFGLNYVGDNKYLHDCGIMYIGMSKILYCIMTSGLDAEMAGQKIGIILKKTYDYIIESRSELDKYKSG